MPPIPNYTILYLICAWGKEDQNAGLCLDFINMVSHSSDILDKTTTPESSTHHFPDGAALISTQDHGSLSEIFPFWRKEGMNGRLNRDEGLFSQVHALGPLLMSFTLNHEYLV